MHNSDRGEIFGIISMMNYSIIIVRASSSFIDFREISQTNIESNPGHFSSKTNSITTTLWYNQSEILDFIEKTADGMDISANIITQIRLEDIIYKHYCTFHK